MLSDPSRQQPRRNLVSFKAAAVLSALATSLLVPLLYFYGHHGTSLLQEHLRTTALTKKDLLIVMTGTTDRMLLSEATRAWRKGVPTVIVMESGYDLEKTSQAFQQGIAQHMETFAEFPDLTERPVKRGDMRATIAPFLANVTVGIDSYKWILFGDDDTAFYVDNALRMLSTLDHNMPYVLSDHIWFPTDTESWDINKFKHPNRLAPRCLPCNYSDPAEASAPQHQSYVGFKAPRGCPCTEQDVCASDNLGYFSDGNCDPRRFQWFWPHGGAGLILSQGLMRMREYAPIEEAVKRMNWPAGWPGDFAISRIILDEFGIMTTDPGYGYFRPSINLFDPGWRLTPDGHDSGTHAAAVMDRFEMALQGWCNEECEDQLQHLITVHLGAREAAWHHQDTATAVKHHSSQSANDDQDHDHMHVGMFLHTRLGYLFKHYTSARRLLKLDWMSHAFTASDPPTQ